MIPHDFPPLLIRCYQRSCPSRRHFLGDPLTPMAYTQACTHTQDVPRSDDWNHSQLRPEFDDRRDV